MSVRAYKLIKIEHEQEPTFNLWHDELACDLLGIYGLETISEGGGIAYIQRDDVENAIENVEDYKDNEFYEDTKVILQKVLKDCDEFGVEYHCF